MSQQRVPMRQAPTLPKLGWLLAVSAAELKMMKFVGTSPNGTPEIFRMSYGSPWHDPKNKGTREDSLLANYQDICCDLDPKTCSQVELPLVYCRTCHRHLHQEQERCNCSKKKTQDRLPDIKNISQVLSRLSTSMTRQSRVPKFDLKAA